MVVVILMIFVFNGAGSESVFIARLVGRPLNKSLLTSLFLFLFMYLKCLMWHCLDNTMSSVVDSQFQMKTYNLHYIVCKHSMSHAVACILNDEVIRQAFVNNMTS